MSFLNRFFRNPSGGRSRPAATLSQMAPLSQQSQLSKSQPPSPMQHRRELARVALRDTLIKAGIPTAWIGAEMVTVPLKDGNRGLHLRLQLRHWDARVMEHAVAIEDAFGKRLTMFDPMASNWLTGISWQYALADESGCPPLPEPGYWTLKPGAGKPAVDVELVDLAAADAADRRAELSALMARSEAMHAALAAAHPGAPEMPVPGAFDPTQPMGINSRPVLLAPDPDAATRIAPIGHR